MNATPHCVIVFGANGCGKTTLARELAGMLNYKHMDIEDYAFAPSDIPYSVERTLDDRIALMLADIEKYGSFVMSAVVGDFGKQITAMYDLAIMLRAPAEIRRERIERRAFQQFGERMMAGGDMYERERRFIDFAASRPLEPIDRWAETLTCPVLRMDGTAETKILAAEIVKKYWRGRVYEKGTTDE